MAASSPTKFRIEEVAIGSAAMVSLYGELDIQSQDQVAAGLSRALDRHPAALAADLRGLTFMDSTGVHALLDAEARCREQGTAFFIIRGTGAVDRVLSVLGLDRLFEIITEPEQLAGRLSPVPGAV
jgi:anti-sigma B factor antagonist